MRVSPGKALGQPWPSRTALLFPRPSYFCSFGVISAMLALHLLNMFPLNWWSFSDLNLF